MLEPDFLSMMKAIEARLGNLESGSQNKKITIPTGGKFVLNIETSDPPIQNGKIYYNSTTKTIRVCVNGGWVDLLNNTDTGWIAPTMSNGWTNYDGTFNLPGYYKDSLGFVHLRGLVKSGTAGSVIFVLPAGYRPARRMLFAVCTDANTIGRCDVDTAGNVVHSSGSINWFSLDGLTFKAEG